MASDPLVRATSGIRIDERRDKEVRIAGKKAAVHKRLRELGVER